MGQAPVGGAIDHRRAHGAKTRPMLVVWERNPLRCRGERPRTLALSSAIPATVELRRNLANTEERDGIVDARHADRFATG
jgi:hypothetical protein